MVCYFFNHNIFFLITALQKDDSSSIDDRRPGNSTKKKICPITLTNRVDLDSDEEDKESEDRVVIPEGQVSGCKHKTILFYVLHLFTVAFQFTDLFRPLERPTQICRKEGNVKVGESHSVQQAAHQGDSIGLR